MCMPMAVAPLPCMVFEHLQLGYRLAHVLRRLLPISLDLMQRDAATLHHAAGAAYGCSSGRAADAGSGGGAEDSCVLPVAQEVLTRRVAGCFHAFLEEVERSCKAK